MNIVIDLFITSSAILYEKISSRSDGVTKQKKVNGTSFSLFHQNLNGSGLVEIGVLGEVGGLVVTGWGGGDCIKYYKRWWDEKKRWGNKNFK